MRLQSRLNSGTARVEDRFDATTIVPYERNGRVLVPAGSVMRGVVNSVTPASRGINRKGELTLVFDRFSIDGRTYSIRATVMQALQGEADTGRVAAGAGVGAIIGGILGGTRGALTGILIGGGGTVAATEGNEVDLAPGTVLRVRLDAPLELGTVASSRRDQGSSSGTSDLLHCFAGGFDRSCRRRARYARPTGTTLRTETAEDRRRARACP